MGSKLYVGNLSYNTTSSDLEQLFSQHGTVPVSYTHLTLPDE